MTSSPSSRSMLPANVVKMASENIERSYQSPQSKRKMSSLDILQEVSSKKQLVSGDNFKHMVEEDIRVNNDIRIYLAKGVKRDIDLDDLGWITKSKRSDNMLQGFMQLMKRLKDIKSSNCRQKIVNIHGNINIGKTTFSILLRDVLVSHGYNVMYASQSDDSLQKQTEILNTVSQFKEYRGINCDCLLIDNYNLGVISEKDIVKLYPFITESDGPFPAVVMTSSGTFFADRRHNKRAVFLGVHFQPTLQEVRLIIKDEQFPQEHYNGLMKKTPGLGDILDYSLMTDTEGHIYSEENTELSDDFVKKLAMPIPYDGIIPLETCRFVSLLARKASSGRNCHFAKVFLSRCKLAISESQQNLPYQEVNCMEDYRLQMVNKPYLTAINARLSTLAKTDASKIYDEVTRRYCSFYNDPCPEINPGAMESLYELVLLCKLRYEGWGLCCKDNNDLFQPNCSLFYGIDICGVEVRKDREITCPMVVKELLRRKTSEKCETVYLNGIHQSKGYGFIHLRQQDETVKLNLIKVSICPQNKHMAVMKEQYDAVEEVLQDSVREEQITSYTLTVSMVTTHHEAERWKQHQDNFTTPFKENIMLMEFDPESAV